MKNTLLSTEDIVDAENKLLAAQLISNADMLDALLADELIAIVPDGQIITKEMDLNAHRQKPILIMHQRASTKSDSWAISHL